MGPRGRLRLPPSNLQSASGAIPGHTIETEEPSPCPKPSSSPPVARPIGRAIKGSLVDMRPDDLDRARRARRARTRCPSSTPHEVEDVILGCGQPAGEAGYNVARVAAILAGLDDVPGVTVNRYCSSSLQTIRMAAHAIRAGEGDVFVAAGVETVSRFASGASDTGHPQPALRRRRGAHARPAPRRHRALDAASRVSPTSTSPWARRPRTSPSTRRSAREEMDEFALLSPGRAPSRHQENGFFEREIIPVTLPDGTVVTKDDGPRAGTTLEGLASLQARLPRGRHRHRRQRLPAQRRRGGGRRHERHQGQGSSASRRSRASWRAASPASTPRSWASARSRPAARRSTRANMTIDDIDLVEINEAFAAQVIPSRQAPRHHAGTSSTSSGGAIALGHPFGRPARAS